MTGKIISERDFVFSTTRVLACPDSDAERHVLGLQMLGELIAVYESSEEFGRVIEATGGLVRSWISQNNGVRLSYALLLARFYIGAFLPTNTMVCKRTYDIFRTLMRLHPVDLKVYREHVRFVLDDIDQRGIPVQASVLSKLQVSTERFPEAVLPEAVLQQESELALLVTTAGELLQSWSVLKRIQERLCQQGESKHAVDWVLRIRPIPMAIALKLKILDQHLINVTS